MKNRWTQRIITGLLLLLLIGTLGMSTWLMGSGSTYLCQKCHVMKPQAMTWSVSSHRNIPCATCHIEPSIKYRLRFSISLIPKAYHVLTQSVILPVHVENTVRNDSCLQCHTPNRTVTPRNDLIVPHDLHYLNGVYCTECHPGVTHGQIDERYQTIDGDFKKWTQDYSKGQMTAGNLRIGMKECMECHQNKGTGPLQCTGCHEEKIPPASHKAKTWERLHGQEAMTNIEDCEKCHNYTNVEEKPLLEEEKDVAKYARKNEFCADCHMNSASPHVDGWAIWHSRSISYEDASQCLVCHDLNQPISVVFRSTRTYCAICHEENLGPAFRY